MNNKLIIDANTKATRGTIKKSVKKRATIDPTFLLMVQGAENNSGGKDTAQAEKKQSGKVLQPATKKNHRVHSMNQEQISDGIAKDQSMKSQDQLKNSENVPINELPSLQSVRRTRALALSSSDRLTEGQNVEKVVGVEAENTLNEMAKPLFVKTTHHNHSVNQDQISNGIANDKPMLSQGHLTDSVLADLAYAQSMIIPNEQSASSSKQQYQQDKNVDGSESLTPKNVQRMEAPDLKTSDFLTAGSTVHSLADANISPVRQNSNQPEKVSLPQESVIQQPVEGMTIKNTDEQFNDYRANSSNSVAALGAFLQTSSDSASPVSSDVNRSADQDVGQKNYHAVLVSGSVETQNDSEQAKLANNSLSTTANPNTAKRNIERLQNQAVRESDAPTGAKPSANVPEKAGGMPSNTDANGPHAFPLHTVALQQMSALAMWRDYQTGSSSAPPVPDQVGSQMASWLGKATFNQNEDGVKSMTMTLYPENLGQVTITVQQDKDGIVAMLTTSNKGAEDLLKNGLDQLQKDLVNQGLPVHQIDVTVKQETTAQNQQHTFQGQQQSRQGTDQGNHQNPRQSEPQNLYNEEEDSEKQSFNDWIIEGSV